MTTTILLIRHGQTDWNRTERFRGQIDVPLNETGLHQADLTGRYVAANWRPVALFSSPLPRTVRTADAIGKYAHLSVVVQAGLIDINYGEWQGLTPQEARQHWPDLVEAWYHDPARVKIPGGETLQEVRERSMAALKELIRQHPDQTIVLVSHSAVIRLILLSALGLGVERFWHLRQEPCAVNGLEFADGEYTLVSMNETAHLQEEK